MNRADKMLELLDDGKNWTKGTLKDGNNYCLMGANLYCGLYDMYGEQELHELMRDVIEEQYPDRKIDRYAAIPGFNDHDDTNWDDIRTILEKVSSILDERI